MIEDLPDIASLLATGAAAVENLQTTANRAISALRIGAGQLLVAERWALPLVQGRTSTPVFGKMSPAKNRELLAGLDPARMPPRGRFEDAVVVNGSLNYYHFLVFNMPRLLFLAQLAHKTSMTLVTTQGFPASATALMTRLLPVLANGRAVEVVMAGEGLYDIADTIIPVRTPSDVPVWMGGQVVLPFVLREAGISDPLRALGPLKLFVRRDGAATGRNLVNQAEVETWLAARGYTSVNPGTLSMEDQVILFSRATDIVGVEGAAMTNIIFAVNAKRIAVLKSPAVNDEKFFSILAKNMTAAFSNILGEIDPAHLTAGRAANYTIAIAKLEALISEPS